MNRLLFLAVFVFMIWATGRAIDAEAHYRPGAHNAIHAINLSWCGKGPLIHQGRDGLVPRCWQGRNAARVARCEASARYWPKYPHLAKNGQYLGMFQMGEWARSNYGHGPGPWHQARAAHKNWLANGWSQWECASILGIR